MMQKPRKIGLNLDSTLTIGPVFMGVHFENWRDIYWIGDKYIHLHISLISFPIELTE